MFHTFLGAWIAVRRAHLPPASSLFRVCQKARVGAFHWVLTSFIECWLDYIVDFNLNVKLCSSVQKAFQFDDVTVFVGCHEEDIQEGHEASQLWCAEAGAKGDGRVEATETVATGRAFEHAIGIWGMKPDWLTDVQNNLKAV